MDDGNVSRFAPRDEILTVGTRDNDIDGKVRKNSTFLHHEFTLPIGAADAARAVILPEAAVLRLPLL
jgi:hypothetical protein